MFFTRRLARITANGAISALVHGGDSVIDVRIPTNRAVFFHAIADRHGRRRPDSATPPGERWELVTSEQGKSLRGLLRVFGDLQAVGRAFGDKVWREVLFSMAGKPLHGKDRHRHHVARVVREAIEAHGVELAANEAVLAELSDRLFLPAPKQRRHRIADFRREYGKVHGKGWGDPYGDGEPFFEWLVEIGALQQGAEFTCPTCGRSLSSWLRRLRSAITESPLLSLAG
jgi:hypothetical protein